MRAGERARGRAVACWRALALCAAAHGAIAVGARALGAAALGAAALGAMALVAAMWAFPAAADDAPSPVGGRPSAVVSVAADRSSLDHGARCNLDAGTPRAVVKVVDGETLLLDDGSEVRLVGALAPRAFDAGVAGADWPAERAARAHLAALVAGRTVALASPSARRSDRYGRRLSQVVMPAADDRGGTEARIWLQAEMVAAGHARAYGLPDSFDCTPDLLIREAAARAAGVGLWSHPAYALREAGHTRDLLRLRNTFQLVEGVVRGIAEVRGRIYVNFGDDWRSDFTAGVATAHADAGWLTAVRGLAGHRVRVRGWIERQNGPYIAVTDASQIEVLDAGGGPAAALPDPPSRQRRRAPATVP